MSSIVQYKELVKRDKQVINKLKVDLHYKDEEIKKLNQRLSEIRFNMKELLDKHYNRKWWQF